MVKEDMAEVEVTEEDTEDRINWRRQIRCGDPWWEKPKQEEEVPRIFTPSKSLTDEVGCVV